MSKAQHYRHKDSSKEIEQVKPAAETFCPACFGDGEHRMPGAHIFVRCGCSTVRGI